MYSFVRNSGSDGFSLMEVLIAMAILSVGLLGTAALLNGVIRSDKLSATMSAATALGQDEMERVKRLGFAGVVNGTITRSDTVDLVLYTIERVVDTPDANMKMVAVTVSWSAFGTHSILFQTILAK